MEPSPTATPWFAARLLSRVVATGSTAAAAAGVRAGTRSVELCLRRSPTLLRLALESGTSFDGAAAAQSGLRDELLGLARDLADVSWHETRRVLEQLDAGTRAEDLEVVTGRRRRARVKP